VVEAAIARRRRWVTSILSLLAVALLGTMVLSGQLRESRQFVAFAPAGVMPDAPAEIDRIELRTAAGHWRFVRGSDGWRTASDGPVLSAALATSLDESIKFMHVSAPVRVMERTEWVSVGLREFGLDPPGYTATLYRRDVEVLGAEFGALNPQRVLQYMRLHGGDRIYLMSRFVGQEWENALREATRG
jgi:hypothetical protein